MNSDTRQERKRLVLEILKAADRPLTTREIINSYWEQADLSDMLDVASLLGRMHTAGELLRSRRLDTGRDLGREPAPVTSGNENLAICWTTSALAAVWGGALAKGRNNA